MDDENRLFISGLTIRDGIRTEPNRTNRTRTLIFERTEQN